MDSQRPVDFAVERENDIGIGDEGLGAAHAFGLDVVGGSAESGSVDKANGPPADVEPLLDRVARGAGCRRDDCAASAEKRVHERRLAGVGGSGENDEGSVAENASLVRARERVFYSIFGGGGFGGRIVEKRRRQVGLVDIKRVLESRREAENLVIEAAIRLCGGAALTGDGVVGCAIGLRVDQLDDALGFAEVHTSIEERALGELAATGEAGAGGEAGLEYAARRNRAAVALELDDILASVAARRCEREDDAPVEYRAVQRECPEGDAAWLRRRASQPLGDGERVGA